MAKRKTHLAAMIWIMRHDMKRSIQAIRAIRQARGVITDRGLENRLLTAECWIENLQEQIENSLKIKKRE